MIVPHSSRLALLTVKYIGLPMLGLIAYDVVIVLLYQAGYLKWAALEQIPLSLFGSVIGVILAFRNSSSYARWWEARTLWGSIVNNSRSWARAVTTVMRGDGDHPEFARIRQQMV
jgi:putative membrane protein